MGKIKEEVDNSKVKVHLENKANMKIERLGKPEDTLEFMEHMLHQTNKVEFLGQQVKKIGKMTGIFAALGIGCALI